MNYQPTDGSQSHRPAKRRQLDPNTAAGSPLSRSTFLSTACERCREKKIRCDAHSTRCTPCAKVNADCKLVSSVSQRSYDWGYVKKLEESLRHLQVEHDRIEERLQRAKAIPKFASATLSGVSGNATPSFTPQTPSSVQVDKRAPPERFFGEENAMGFINVILAKIRAEAKKNMEMLHVQKATNGTDYSERNLRKTGLFPMPIDMGHRLTEVYLRRAQARHPFLARSDILSVCEKVLENGSSSHVVSDDEGFRAYMIFAIASVYMIQEHNSLLRTYSSNLIDPEALFSIAVRGGTKINLLRGLEGMQNLLLLSRFCFFYLTGASLWEISSLCLRICAEHEYHRPPKSNVSAFEEQMQRRVFWQCYCLDRHCSTTLGLPFGIPDSEITVANIVDVGDDYLIGNDHPLHYIESSLSSALGTSELRLAISQVRLRRLCSRMVEDFKDLRRKTPSNTSQWSCEFTKNYSTSASAWNLYVRYRNELSRWREAHSSGLAVISPTSTVEESYLGERWRDLHYFQEKLLLIRCSIDHSSKSTGMINPLDLSNELYDAASNVIKLYDKLLRNASMEPTPGRLYRILTAGLSVLFAVIIEKQESKGGTTNNLEHNMSMAWFAERVAVLKLCRDDLATISRHLSVENGSLKYASYFELLCREVFRSLPHPSFWRNTDEDTARKNMHDVNADHQYRNSSRHNWTADFNGVNGGNLIGDSTAMSTQTTPATQPTIFSAESSNFLNALEPDSAPISSSCVDGPEMASPFSWLQYSSSDLSNAGLFCHNVLEHPNPCYCALMTMPANSDLDTVFSQQVNSAEPPDFMYNMFTGFSASELEVPSLSWPHLMSGTTDYGSMMFDGMDV